MRDPKPCEGCKDKKQAQRIVRTGQARQKQVAEHGYLPEITACEETGYQAINGACPIHKGDSCLAQYTHRNQVRRLNRIVAELNRRLKTGAR